MKACLGLVVLFFVTLPTQANTLPPKTVAIVGGGMSGTAAAAFLQNTAFQVHLYEKQGQLGGNAQTLWVPNGEGDKVAVDIGPQYFARPAWNLYLDFLREFDLYSKKDTRSFHSSIAIFREGDQLPEFRSLQFTREHLRYKLKVRNEFGKNLKVFKMLGALHRHFKQNNVSEKMTVGDFLANLRKVSEEDKQQLLRPIMASVLNADIQTVDQLALRSIVQALGFRRSSASKYYVSKPGFGTLIQRIGHKLETARNIHIHRDSEVLNLTKLKNKFVLTHLGQAGIETKEFDYVILAVNPMIAQKLLTGYLGDLGITIQMQKALSRFDFKTVRIALHTEKDFVPSEFSSFFNIRKNKMGDQIKSITMKLDKIAPIYGNVLKSWVFDEREYEQMQQAGKVLATRIFSHPIVTPEFYQAVHEIKRLGLAAGGLYFAGGWTTDFETQYSAIEAAYRSVKSIAPLAAQNWEKRLKSLRKIPLY